MKRFVTRMLPDGTVRYVQPYHVSMEGLEKMVVCRDEEDYDTMVKIICICARRKNVIVIIYTVVSNHCHVAILAANQSEADDYAAEIKRMYSMWMARKYGLRSSLKGVGVQAVLLDSDWYARNALAYIPRNALDNGCNVSEYPWSGYRAMFSQKKVEEQGRPVASMCRDERREVMRSGDDFRNVSWRVDGGGRLIPESFCDHQYLEQAFENDQTFFLKTIGGQNPSEMHFKLIDSHRNRLPDSEFRKTVEEVSQRWFQIPLDRLSLERKCRLVPYVDRTMRTTVPQLARTFGLSREQVARILGR